MGIYDRDYIRREPPRTGMTGGGLSSMRMWSVNTWLIAACVIVFVVDALTPRTLWRPVQVSRDVPPYVDLVGGAQYKEIGDAGKEQRALRSPVPIYKRVVFDTQTQQAVGSVTYQWMPPLQRWFHFSTLTAFRRLEVWRFVGFQFLHANLMHLLFNMIALYFFGPVVERYLGRKRYLAFYLLCGICGALVYLALNLGGYLVSWLGGGSLHLPGLLFNSPATPLVGASAGVFGVLMAGAFLMPNALVLLFFILPMRLAFLAYALVAMSLLTLIFGGPNAGGEAGHLGGAIAGFYFIRHPHRLHGFFDVLGWADPTSHHYRGRRGRRGAGPGRDEVDRILDKISDTGLHSLTEREKRILREASQRE